MSNQSNQRLKKRRRQFRSQGRMARIVLLTTLFAILIFLGAMPLLESVFQSDAGTSSKTDELFQWIEVIRVRMMELLIAAWFFAFGSMVGSFINVVVYRMPLGKSVIAKPSACPYCQTNIRLSDNIPIFGWIKLRGRCRICRLPISPRYPIVELIFGCVFLALFFAELQTGAANIPNHPRYLTTGILAIVLDTKWDVISIYAFHATLLTLLMAWSLMAIDGNRPPLKTIVFALLIGVIAPAIAPYLHPVKWIDQHAGWFADVSLLKRVDTGFLGLTAGYFAGGFIDLILSRKGVTNQSRSRNAAYFSIGLMTVGLWLGWQAVATIVACTAFLLLVAYAARTTFSKNLNWLNAMTCLTISTIVQILGWRWIHNIANATALPGWAIYGIVLMVGIGLICLLPGHISNWSRQVTESSDREHQIEAPIANHGTSKS